MFTNPVLSVRCLCIDGGHRSKRLWQIHEINRWQFSIKTLKNKRFKLCYSVLLFCVGYSLDWEFKWQIPNTDNFSVMIRAIKTHFISKNFIAHSLFHCLRLNGVRASWNVQKLHSDTEKYQEGWSRLHIWIQYLWCCKQKILMQHHL